MNNLICCKFPEPSKNSYFNVILISCLHQALSWAWPRQRDVHPAIVSSPLGLLLVFAGSFLTQFFPLLAPPTLALGQSLRLCCISCLHNAHNSWPCLHLHRTNKNHGLLTRSIFVWWQKCFSITLILLLIKSQIQHRPSALRWAVSRGPMKAYLMPNPSDITLSRSSTLITSSWNVYMHMKVVRVSNVFLQKHPSLYACLSPWLHFNFNRCQRLATDPSLILIYWSHLITCLNKAFNSGLCHSMGKKTVCIRYKTILPVKG